MGGGGQGSGARAVRCASAPCRLRLSTRGRGARRSPRARGGAAWGRRGSRETRDPGACGNTNSMSLGHIDVLYGYFVRVLRTPKADESVRPVPQWYNPLCSLT